MRAGSGFFASLSFAGLGLARVSVICSPVGHLSRCGISQGRRDSNPQPPVLETGTLPIELRPFGGARCPHAHPTDPIPGALARGASSLRRAESTHRAAPGSNRTGGSDRWEHGRMRQASRVSHRIGAISESATLAVDAKAKALKAAGRPVIGFGAGEPDFPTPDYIVQAAIEACSNPKYHRYTPAGGLPELKAAIAAKTLRDSGYEVEAAQVLVTNGGKQAIYEAFAALVDPGDEVILPAPYWTTYPEAIRLAGGVPVEALADETQDYKVTVEQLEAARTERTQVLLSSSPSNPTGSVYSVEEVKAIGAWVEEHGLWVVTDEIYEHLVYDGFETGSLPVLCPALTDTCVVVNGVA